MDKRPFATLDEREEMIIKMRFGIGRGHPMTLEEVGQFFNLTRERIRQIEMKALDKMRATITQEQLVELITEGK